MRRVFLNLVLALALGAPATSYAGHDVGPKPPGSFDYYVLSLTWVPGFCAIKHDPQECGKGLGFGLHGLWPQFANGDYPTSCSQVPLSPQDRQKFQGDYPSPTMIQHEWDKHGTCSGLAPVDYFNLSVADENVVKIPPAYRQGRVLKAQDVPALKAAFRSANPTLPADGMVTAIAGGKFTEIRFCITKVGTLRSCSAS